MPRMGSTMRTQDQELNYNYEYMLCLNIELIKFRNYDELGWSVVTYDLCDMDGGGIHGWWCVLGMFFLHCDTCKCMNVAILIML